MAVTDGSQNFTYRAGRSDRRLSVLFDFVMMRRIEVSAHELNRQSTTDCLNVI